MPVDKKQGLVARQTLSAEELTAIKQLTAICEDYERLYMRLSWGMLQTRSGKQAEDFLYYVDNQLVGYLAMDGHGTETRELVGMVHPDHRREGIFRTLLTAAQTECQRHGVQRLVLICEHSSRSGKAFVEAIKANYDTSEHEMILEHFRERAAFDDRLVLRPADDSDVEGLVTIVQSDGLSEEEARRWVKRVLSEPISQTYIATFGVEGVSCGEPIGTLRVDNWDELAGIYGFVVLPAYRGRGYGRQMLEEVIRSIRATSQKTIMLDVDTNNINAIGLYRSCGFAIKTTYDYYVINIGN
ncbi:MAG TPA: GNAT family N-acetyltransferase [Ktedonosporobacter sp.]|nr:GNAT family N-acetyltransferase [Ktedonosporobacter sp.]